MTIEEKEFWSLIDRSRLAADGDSDDQADELEALLTGRSAEDLRAFERIYRTLRRRRSAGILLWQGRVLIDVESWRESTMSCSGTPCTAYRETHGRELESDGPPEGAEPDGTRFDPHDIGRGLPRLYSKWLALDDECGRVGARPR